MYLGTKGDAIMKFNALVQVTLFASSLSPSFVLGYCGTNTTYVPLEQNIQARTVAERAETHPIDVFFHVASTHANEDLITEEMVDTQVSTQLSSSVLEQLT